MIPYQSGLTPFSSEILPDRTFALDFETLTESGTVSGVEAVRQAAFLVLQTERYQHLIYSRQYGVELAGLLGRPVSYSYPEIQRRITEALMRDDRIRGVSDFTFLQDGRRVHVSFVICTIYGSVPLDANF